MRFQEDKKLLAIGFNSFISKLFFIEVIDFNIKKSSQILKIESQKVATLILINYETQLKLMKI